MKKLLSFILFLIAAGHSLFAQQDPLSTMFMTNPFVLNPAIAGTNKYFQVISSNRFQWVGLADAPITNSLSVYGPMVKYPMGWGGTIYYDVCGPVSTGTLHGAYAYQYNINEDMNLSAGLNVGIMQYKIDFSKIDMPNETDDPVMNSKESYYIPDANVGFYFWSSTYHAGLVFRHILNRKINIYESTNRDSVSRLKPHIYLTGGYKYYINREWAIEPSIVLKKVWPAPFQLDVNVRVWYNNNLWGGLSYRTQEALSAMIGYTYDRKIYIGYSYDFLYGINALGAHNLGSHEIMIGYRFNDIKD